MIICSNSKIKLEVEKWNSLKLLIYKTAKWSSQRLLTTKIIMKRHKLQCLGCLNLAARMKDKSYSIQIWISNRTIVQGNWTSLIMLTWIGLMVISSLKDLLVHSRVTIPLWKRQIPMSPMLKDKRWSWSKLNKTRLQWPMPMASMVVPLNLKIVSNKLSI